MGYKDYAKDYEIEYVERLGRRPRAVRIYVGPYYVFTCPEEELKKLRRFYLAAVLASALLLLLPMCIDCTATRTWYVQLPAAGAWIAWLLAASAVWRLWTATGKMEREHSELISNRLSGGAAFMMGLSAVSSLGCVLLFVRQGALWRDVLVMLCNVLLCIISALMFSKRRLLVMKQVENPERPRAKNK